MRILSPTDIDLRVARIIDDEMARSFAVDSGIPRIPWAPLMRWRADEGLLQGARMGAVAPPYSKVGILVDGSRQAPFLEQCATVLDPEVARERLGDVAPDVDTTTHARQPRPIPRVTAKQPDNKFGLSHETAPMGIEPRTLGTPGHGPTP